MSMEIVPPNGSLLSGNRHSDRCPERRKPQIGGVPVIALRRRRAVAHGHVVDQILVLEG